MRKLFACVLAIVPGLLGCVTPVRQGQDADLVRSVRTQTERRFLESPDGALGEPWLEATLMLEIESEESVERVTETWTDSVRWQARREFVEVPLGVIALPFAFGAGLAQLAAPSLRESPRRFARFPGWALHAANPARNTPDLERAERRVVATRGQWVGTEARRRVSPLEGGRVWLNFPGGPRFAATSGSQGRVSVHLLDVARGSLRAAPPFVELDLEAGTAARELRPVRLSARLADGLLRASRLVAALERPNASADELAGIVHRVHGLGFPEYALQLEDELGERYADDPGFVAHLRQKLAKRYGTGLAAPTELE